MPAYNRERYLVESIQSVIAQTYSHWELVIIDDGSTDSTARIAQSFAASNKKIKYIFQRNGGPASARNTGLRNANGDLVAFLDSDDLWLSQKLELQVKSIDETDADFVFSSGFIFDNNNADDETKVFEVEGRRYDGGSAFDSLLIHNYIPTSSVMFRKNVLERSGLFDETLVDGSEDYDLWLRMAKTGAVFCGTNDKLVRYRRHPSSITHKRSSLFKPMLEVVSRHIDESRLSVHDKNRRLRELYREIIAALLEEGQLTEAKAYLNRLASWDRSSIVIMLQRVLIKLLPRQYNFLSRECLYRTEWHLKKAFGKV